MVVIYLIDPVEDVVGEEGLVDQVMKVQEQVAVDLFRVESNDAASGCSGLGEESEFGSFVIEK